MTDQLRLKDVELLVVGADVSQCHGGGDRARSVLGVERRMTLARMVMGCSMTVVAPLVIVMIFQKLEWNMDLTMLRSYGRSTMVRLGTKSCIISAVIVQISVMLVCTYVEVNGPSVWRMPIVFMPLRQSINRKL